MKTIDLVWSDFVDAKFGDEYLILFLGRKKHWRKLFKFFTLLAAAGGVISALIDAKVPTIIICTAICAVQLLSVFENSFIASEKDIEKLIKLRLLYCNYCGDLENLYCVLSEDNLSDEKEEEIKVQYFNLKKDKNTTIEPIDTEIDVKKRKKLLKRADNTTRQYLNRYI